jgi:hypothetical protein
MPTKRRQIARRCRLTWVAQVLAEGRPPMDYTEWQEFQRGGRDSLQCPVYPTLNPREASASSPRSGPRCAEDARVQPTLGGP